MLAKLCGYALFFIKYAVILHLAPSLTLIFGTALNILIAIFYFVFFELKNTF